MTTAMKRSTVPKRKCKILLVDDHPLTRYGLRQIVELEADLEVCGEAANASDARQLVAALSPDLIILDISLADSSGFDVIQDVRSLRPDAIVLIASMHDESIYAERAICAGANGYVTKNTPAKQIIKAIRRVLTGEIYLSPSMTSRLVQRKNSSAGIRDQSSPVESLSQRELEVLTYIGHGMRTCDIAERLSLSVKTIESYRQHIKRKLILKNSTELIHYAVHWNISRGLASRRPTATVVSESAM